VLFENVGLKFQEQLVQKGIYRNRWRRRVWIVIRREYCWFGLIENIALDIGIVEMFEGVISFRFQNLLKLVPFVVGQILWLHSKQCSIKEGP
jgi:hypothetical protein